MSCPAGFKCQQIYLLIPSVPQCLCPQPMDPVDYSSLSVCVRIARDCHTFRHPIIHFCIPQHIHRPKPSQSVVSVTPSIGVSNRSTDLQVFLFQYFVSIQQIAACIKCNHLFPALAIYCCMLLNLSIGTGHSSPGPCRHIVCPGLPDICPENNCLVCQCNP